MTSDIAIAAEGLSKIYTARWSGLSRQACDNITVSVPTGSAFGLLGANGAGKTTFVKMVLSIVHPTAGRSYLFGQNSFEPEARRHIGYLPENHRFPTYLTARTMLDYYAGLSGLGASDRAKRIPELLDLVGLSSAADLKLRKFSKGMLQRVGLAQALIHRPKLLILDEPGDGVDPVGRRQIRDILRQQQEKGVTIFINSHLLSEVEMFCDSVAILKAGKVALTGSIRDLTQGRGVRLRAKDVPPALASALASQAMTSKIDLTIAEYLFSTSEQANAAIDQLRLAGCLIDSLVESRSTLEDVFIDTVQQPAAAPQEVLA